MTQQINLRPLFNELGKVQNNLLVINDKIDNVDVRVGNINQDLNNTRAKLLELAEAFQRFTEQAERTAAVQRAETQVGNLKDELDRVYGHYALVRRTSLGVLQAFDVGNVTNDIVTQVSEELMIQSPRYWLAPALVALAAWSRNDEDICKKSIHEAFTRNVAKTSLFFALILRRTKRQEDAYLWLKEYLDNCDCTKLGREFAVIMEASARGAFGPQAEQLVAQQMHEWATELNQHSSLKRAQVEAWIEELQSDRQELVVDGYYDNLRRFSPNFPQVKSSLESATALGVAVDKFTEIRDAVDAPFGKIEDLLDQLLEQLVKEYDEEELPLRRQIAHAEAIIETNGDLQQAEVRASKYNRALEETIDAMSLQTRVAISAERLGASTSTQRVAVGNCLGNISEAVREYTANYRGQFTHSVEIVLNNDHSGYAAELGFGQFISRTDEDEQNALQRLRQYWDSVLASHIASISFSVSKYLVHIIICVVAAVLLILSSHMGLIGAVLVLGGLGFYLYLKKGEADKALAKIEEIKGKAIEVSNNLLVETRAEFTDLLLEYEDQDAREADLNRVFDTWSTIKNAQVEG